MYTRRSPYRVGSIQDIPGIPTAVKEIFLTAWELDQKVVIDLAADRAPFIDQTQSMSLNVSHPTSDLMVRVYVSHSTESKHAVVVRSSASRMGPGTEDWPILPPHPSTRLPAAIWCRQPAFPASKGQTSAQRYTGGLAKQRSASVRLVCGLMSTSLNGASALSCAVLR